MKKFLYLYNPFSGLQSGGRDLDMIIGTFYKNGIYLIPHRLFTLENDEILDEYLSKKDLFDAVIISGGDGTVGQIVDRMVKAGNDTPVGVVHGGTCNDFARNLKMPVSLFDCINIFCEYNVERVDMLKVTAGDKEQYICNSIAAGAFVGVSHTTSPEFKKVFGSLAYYISALGEISDMKPFRIRIKTENETVEEDALVFAVLNGSDVGGMKNLISEADLTDGLMNIMVVRDCNFAERAGVGINLLARKGDKNIISLKCHRASVSVDRNMEVSLDGENGLKLPYLIENISKKLNVLVPKDFKS